MPECEILTDRNLRMYGSGNCNFDGAPGRSRTHNPQIRSLVLYPVELRAQWNFDILSDGVAIRQSAPRNDKATNENQATKIAINGASSKTLSITRQFLSHQSWFIGISESRRNTLLGLEWLSNPQVSINFGKLSATFSENLQHLWVKMFWRCTIGSLQNNCATLLMVKRLLV